jgi:hypothetical protein
MIAYLTDQKDVTVAGGCIQLSPQHADLSRCLEEYAEHVGVR